MSKKINASNQTDVKPAPVAGRMGPLAIGIAVLALVGLWLAFGWWRVTHTTPTVSSVVTASAGRGPLISQPASVAEPRAEFKKLTGQWLRPDGGYILELKIVDGNGKLDASYRNPNSIHVAKAEASQSGETTKVFVELRDVNYPGSTYDLTFDPQTDQLKGIYYQATLQQQYEVVFVRNQ